MGNKNVKATLNMSQWQEETYNDADGVKLAKATSHVAFAGDLDGEGETSWLLAYPGDGPVSFVGLQTFAGKLGGRVGTFVLQMNGTFKDGTAYVTWSVLPGTGTADLAGLTGQGGYTAPLGQPDVELQLDYAFAE